MAVKLTRHQARSVNYFVQDQEHAYLVNLFFLFSNAERCSVKGIKLFIAIIKDYYNKKKRSFVWRTEITPYNVVVSEIMLQQTQTYRVAPKFDKFIVHFPNFSTLAAAPFPDILLFWKGLGYNRRALYLQKIAQLIQNSFNGQLPDNPATLVTFPGIGKATAASIVAFAFNRPTVFIETNIRTVFIYFFFQSIDNVHDNELLPLITMTLDQENPREWYYALMDYGVMLKETVGNISRASIHHVIQSKFDGSDRQLRGMILQKLLECKHISIMTLANVLNQPKDRIERIIKSMCKDGLITIQSAMLTLIQ